MSEKTFKMSGSISGSLAATGASEKQMGNMIDVGGLSGQLILTASELADRLGELPPECGGREIVVALRMMDPDTRLLVTPDGPLALGNEAVVQSRRRG